MKILKIVALLLFLIGLVCVIYATIMQIILCYQTFGVYIKCFIPHKTAWFYFGIIPLLLGYMFLIFN